MEYVLPSVNAHTIEQFAFTNKKLLKNKIKGIVLDFHGLGDGRLRSEVSDFDIICAENDILSVFPYYGPWSWMNSNAVKFVDELLVAVCEREEVDINEIPIISTGGSMGGLSALMYTRHARITPKACFANCPVCDLMFHATERPDLPRTVYLAFNYDNCSLEESMLNNSPFHQAEHMPDVPYYIVHGTADTAVNIKMHSDRFVAAMRKFGKNITYITVEGMWHCDFSICPEVKKDYFNAIIKACN